MSGSAAIDTPAQASGGTAIQQRRTPGPTRVWAPVANANVRQLAAPAYAHATREHKLIRSGSSLERRQRRIPVSKTWNGAGDTDMHFRKGRHVTSDSVIRTAFDSRDRAPSHDGDDGAEEGRGGRGGARRVPRQDAHGGGRPDGPDGRRARRGRPRSSARPPCPLPPWPLCPAHHACARAGWEQELHGTLPKLVRKAEEADPDKRTLGPKTVARVLELAAQFRYESVSSTVDLI